LLQIVANGAQDLYLTSNPEITFFKTVYRRYTNFAIETIDIPLNQYSFGGKQTQTIYRNGDLINKIALKVKLPAITCGNTGMATGQQVAWVRKLGHAIAQDIELDIGGAKIDEQYSYFLDFWYELTHQTSHERGYRELIGDVPELTTLQTVDSTKPNQVLLPSKTLYIPFQFWFNRHYGLSLPLIALQYHEVKIQLTMGSLSQLLVYTGPQAPTMSGVNLLGASLMTDYVFLDQDERRRFAQVGHEYLITQVQYAGMDTIGSNYQPTVNYKARLVFNHPVTELIWAASVGCFTGANGVPNSFLCYTDATDRISWANAVNNAAKVLVECMFNSNNVSGHAEAPIGTPESMKIQYEPAGFPIDVNINASVQTPVQITFQRAIGGAALPSAGTQVAWVVGGGSQLLGNSGYDYLSQIVEAHVFMTLDVGGTVKPGSCLVSVEAFVVTHSIPLKNLSIPLEYWTTTGNGWNNLVTPDNVAQGGKLFS